MLTRFAVVVPAHNEQDLLPGCLAALRAAILAPSEVIVVADACTDNTARLAARAGAEVVTVNADILVGTVEVGDWSPWPEAVRYAYERSYRSTPRHVHGANLGCAGEAYRGLGGFAEIDHNEDLDLVSRATRAGLQVVYDPGVPGADQRAPLRPGPRGLRHPSGVSGAGGVRELRHRRSGQVPALPFGSGAAFDPDAGA